MTEHNAHYNKKAMQMTKDKHEINKPNTTLQG